MTSATTFSGKDAVVEIMQTVCAKELAQQTSQADVGPGEEVPGPVYAHWMAIILLAGADFSMTFKVFFPRSFPESLLQAKGGLKMEMAFDLMREHCNLTCGSAKRLLGDRNVRVGLSLPFVTRGFDEVFRARSQQSERFEKTWTVQVAKHGQITYKIEVETQPDFDSKLTWSPEMLKDADDGEMEFL